MARPKNMGEFAGTTVRIVRTVRQVHILRGFVGRWSWRIDTTSDVIVRSRRYLAITALEAIAATCARASLK